MRESIPPGTMCPVNILPRLVCLALCTVLLMPAASTRAAETPYNAGVEAWKKKDYPEAAKQWSQAVLAGNLDAMNNLAFLYFNGLGMAPRVPDAIRLWQTAAYAGHSEAQWHLGIAYEQGTGVDKDLLKAYAWYRCSVENATRRKTTDHSEVEAAIESDARRSLEQITVKLGADQLSRARTLANEYLLRYGKAAP